MDRLRFSKWSFSLVSKGPCLGKRGRAVSGIQDEGDWSTRCGLISDKTEGGISIAGVSVRRE